MELDHRKILIIGEDEMILKALKNLPTEKEVRISVARDGFVGLGQAFCLKPHLILLGDSKPEIDRIILLNRLREYDEWGRKVPIFILDKFKLRDSRINILMQDDLVFYFSNFRQPPIDLLEKIKEIINSPF